MQWNGLQEVELRQFIHHISPGAGKQGAASMTGERRVMSSQWMVGGIAVAMLVLSGSSASAAEPRRGQPHVAVTQLAALDESAYDSLYRSHQDQPVAIVGATVLTGTGSVIENGSVLMRDGLIEAVGAGIVVPPGYRVIDAGSKWVTPGLIDTHSHVGLTVSALGGAGDRNEATSANTAGVRVEHSIWSQDAGFARARAGGVTTLQVLPGSTNPFGGRTTVLKNVPSRSVQEMKFPGAPAGLKMAFADNPKRHHGGKGRAPASRMGEIAVMRAAFNDAVVYRRKWDHYRARLEKGEVGEPPARDLALETLAGVLRGEILVHIHAYRVDDLLSLIALSKEFSFHISAFHHVTEAYKIRDVLVRENICSATWAGWWGFSEAFDAIDENVALVHAAGGCVAIHSDEEIVVQRMNVEAATALGFARRAGFDISEGQAIRWVTANPAQALGVLDKVGTLEPKKMADVVVWDKDPFDGYSLAEKVFIDGVLVHDRADPRRQSVSDFELGLFEAAP